ncbi:MAG TPA: hypothetical protein EYG86_07910 [Crocinitomicaceae bacterium]|nr:hypothetical protein [Crocinitomicaceae bacterium]
MKFKILILGTLVTSGFLAYFILDIFFFKEELITSGIKMILFGLILTVLMLLISINKVPNNLKIGPSILSLGIFIPLIISLVKPSYFSASWNLILAGIVLLSGIILFIKLKGVSKILLTVIALGVLYFEFILLLKVEQPVFFSIGGILLIFSSLAALLASFQQVKETS